METPMANTIEGIDHVGVVASDMDRAIHFYTSLLGFSLLARYKPKTTYHREMAYLRFPGTSGAKLELYTLANPPAGEPSYDYKLGLRVLALRVKDVAEEIARLRSAGIEILAEPVRSEAPGVPEDSPVKRRTRAAIKAPDGVIVGLYTWDEKKST
jgi:glyoxylase I family protein